MSRLKEYLILYNIMGDRDASVELKYSNMSKTSEKHLSDTLGQKRKMSMIAFFLMTKRIDMLQEFINLGEKNSVLDYFNNHFKDIWEAKHSLKEKLDIVDFLIKNEIEIPFFVKMRDLL